MIREPDVLRRLSDDRIKLAPVRNEQQRLLRAVQRHRYIHVAVSRRPINSELGWPFTRCGSCSDSAIGSAGTPNSAPHPTQMLFGLDNRGSHRLRVPRLDVSCLHRAVLLHQVGEGARIHSSWLAAESDVPDSDRPRCDAQPKPDRDGNPSRLVRGRIAEQEKSDDSRDGGEDGSPGSSRSGGEGEAAMGRSRRTPQEHDDRKESGNSQQDQRIKLPVFESANECQTDHDHSAESQDPSCGERSDDPVDRGASGTAVICRPPRSGPTVRLQARRAIYLTVGSDTTRSSRRLVSNRRKPTFRRFRAVRFNRATSASATPSRCNCSASEPVDPARSSMRTTRSESTPPRSRYPGDAAQPEVSSMTRMMSATSDAATRSSPWRICAPRHDDKAHGAPNDALEMIIDDETGPDQYSPANPEADAASSAPASPGTHDDAVGALPE